MIRGINLRYFLLIHNNLDKLFSNNDITIKIVIYFIKLKYFIHDNMHAICNIGCIILLVLVQCIGGVAISWWSFYNKCLGWIPYTINLLSIPELLKTT